MLGNRDKSGATGNNIRGRAYRLDILKAIAIVLVLIWHLQPIRIYPVDNLVIPLSKKVVEFLYQKTLLAVPIFYFVSIFLFFKKNKMSDGYIKHRLKRIFAIFIFWSSIQTIIYFIVEKTLVILNLPYKIIFSTSEIWWCLIMGGPSLPEVGDSVFYFLFNLLLLTILSFFYGRYSSKNIDMLMFFIFSIYIMLHQFVFSIPYWRIDNFLIYIPLSHFVANKFYPNMISWKSLKFSLCLYVIFSMFEYVGQNFLNTRSSAYDINSLHWGVISLFLITQLISIKRQKVIMWLSQYSLGLFALHKYWFLFFLFIFHGTKTKAVFTIGDSIIQTMYVLVFITTTIFTCLTIHFLNQNKTLKKFIQ